MISDLDIIDAMIAQGGSFVKNLGKLYRFADSENQRRLREAFPEYWAQYSRVAAQLKERSDRAEKT